MAAEPTTASSGLDRVVAILATTGAVGTEVSVAALRAVANAFGESNPNMVAVAVAHEAEFAGDRVLVGAPRVRDHRAHRAALVALRAGADALEDVLAELVRHALRCEGDIAYLLDPVLDAARATDPDRALATIDVELAAAHDAVASSHALVDRRAAMLALDLGRVDATDRLLAIRDGLHAADTRRRAALTYHASRIAPASLSDALLEDLDATPEIDAPGWASRARALAALQSGDLLACERESRDAVAAAVEHGDLDLESHALIALAHARAWNGNLAGAIDMQRRALRIALRAGGWRAAAVGAGNLASLLVEDLRLDEARTVVDELVDLVDDRGLLVHQEEALLHGARIALLCGDLERARQLADRHAQVVLAVGADDDAVDASYRANRIAELSIALDEPRASDLALRARSLHERMGTSEQELEVTLIEASVGDELRGAHAQARLPGLLGDGEPFIEAQAVTWLARRVALDGIEDARACLGAAIDSVEARRCALLDLALDEAAAVLATTPDRWRRMAAIAGRWQAQGFRIDAALCEAAAGVAAAEVGEGGEATRLLDSAHRALSEIGAANHTLRVRDARARVQQAHAGTPSSRTFLDEVSVEEARELHALSVRRVVPLGARFPEDHVCTIVSGTARVESIDAGGLGTSLFGIVGEGWTTGIAAVVEPDAARRFVTIAHSPCVVEAIPLDALISRGGRSHRFALAIARTLAAQYERIARVLHRRSDPVLDRRIASTVLDAAAEIGATEPDGTIVLRLTRQVLGDLAGTTRESVSRSIAKLASDDLLELRGHRIVVRDVAALRAVADA